MSFKRTNPSRPSRISRNQGPLEVTIDSLTHDGRGIARDRGRVVMVEDALPGDRVKVRVTRQTTKRLDGAVAKILEPSADRVEPPCPWYQQCGGCNMQHISSESLIAFKQDIVLNQLQRFADLKPEQVVDPLLSPEWGYRSRARLAVRWWNGELRMGFRASGSKDIVPVGTCPVLHPELAELIPVLRERLENSKKKRAVSHIELAYAENGHGILLRTPEALHEQDREAWMELAQEKGIHLYLQLDSPDSLVCIHSPDDCDHLRYDLAEQKLKLEYLPVDFTQVNPHINQQMVSRAMEWLAPGRNDRVLDLFCGLGNFTLPLAQKCRVAVGVEGVDALVERGHHNARLNNLNNVEFYQADLAAEPGNRPWVADKADALLLDPPRTGALEILQRLVKHLPKKILYVSCNPATLARDASFLKEQGFHLSRFGVMDMFPQTTHVESIGLFVR
ncbi:23S rRNA (uracil(1939)-C(5))-methyltransferase RlmD [Sansalvadorimonas sp. 2012CJ34-2]|uniref:23S rRNA (uracil(1939)-C(5))-methyltransferase RlmD n=1 Tax=Parendozoicomonas callyspongiae TaxID=2942213 RepID=A0ABT0PJY1_9GAMM|nr:23S rRNA (uracil(1939)-C(5))-methyltransferase RlmD [Sansalvadorimonas sp. 2012CJ34-2]MCL6271581.1 23S rRNA (uracil(1939)-C(5))-methyltransferase RlmD [Sansalvadorimonas sp. 2012CJ34-2]